MSNLEIQHVSKAFGKVQALNDVSANIAEGSITGFLGRNGAGKTTLLNIITNRIFADHGQVLIDGEPALENERAQAKIFYITEKSLYPDEMSVKDVLHITRRFYPGFDLPYALNLAERFQMGIQKNLGGLSTGYRSILKLVLALASSAPLLILDEPVLGLDANFRDLFYKALLQRFDPSVQTVLLSTHLIDEAAGLIENLLLIKDGQILLNQPVDATLQMAYRVTGSLEQVDRYSSGKRVIREETLGALKTATIYQARTESDQNQMRTLRLESSSIGLQDLVIGLTN